MDQPTLTQFRHQLSQWIKQRLDSGRYPFQRIETAPQVIETSSDGQADLVLWINRESLLAGSLILLPKDVDNDLLHEGANLAGALGLGHFVTWAARKVTIWEVIDGFPVERQHFDLPPANKVTPRDFQEAVNHLLESLKIVTVETAVPLDQLTTPYFINLCHLAIRDLKPILAEQARTTADGIKTDQWAEQAPTEKAWLSLWRLLYLLDGALLPPGLQPERLERAISYALSDTIDQSLDFLQMNGDEPDLGEKAAIRFHHLSGRLRQLGWPHQDSSRDELLSGLLSQLADELEMTVIEPGTQGETAHLDIGCHRPAGADDPPVVVASRSYLAGRSLALHFSGQRIRPSFYERITDLPEGQSLPHVFASLTAPLPCGREQIDRHLLNLRRVWPNRRFNLPPKTPSWLWDALFLSGLQAIPGELELFLPGHWPTAPGVDQLWALLGLRYHPLEIERQSCGRLRLRLIPADETVDQTSTIIRPEGAFPFRDGYFRDRAPGLINIVLHVDRTLLPLLQDKTLQTEELSSQNLLGLEMCSTLFLRTTLGEYLWQLCSGGRSTPEITEIAQVIPASGMPLPRSATLATLNLQGWTAGQPLPTQESLDRDLANIFRDLPKLDLSDGTSDIDPTIVRRRTSRTIADKIAGEVFIDGAPRFPEHYLMKHYRPELCSYSVSGPLKVVGTFFDQILLQDPTGAQVEVKGLATAEALVLTSHVGKLTVELPADEELAGEILVQYKSDLQQLWTNLTRTCRRDIPQRQAALNLAQRLWREKNLPPGPLLGF